MSQSGLSAPASPDPDLSGTSSSLNEGQVDQSSRPESRSSISSSSIVDQAAESSRLSSLLDDVDRKSVSGEVIGLDENAQSGGLLEEHKQEMTGKESSKGEDSLEMVSDDDMEGNDSCKDAVKKKAQQVVDPLKDTELDFEEDVVEEEQRKFTEENRANSDGEEDGECEGDNASEQKTEKEEPEEGEELEEGEVSSEEDVGKHARMEPRPVCRFYSKGNCTWGNNCRFVHPGVLDKGNYNMFAPARPPPHNGPPAMFERPFDRPPIAPIIPPAEWSNAAPRAAGGRARHPQVMETARPSEAAGGAESAWERGLRQAKEMLKKSSHRKETDIDFEEKKLNLGLGEEDLDKENDYYTRPASPMLHADVPPPYDEPDVEAPYHRPPPPEGRWPPSRYPPPHRHHPPGYPYPYEGRRPYPEPEFRDREYYHPEGYDRPHFYGAKSADREHHGPPGKSQAPPPDKRWPDERYAETGPPPGPRTRSDEWYDPWMRSRSPPGGGPSAGGGTGGTNVAVKGGRRRSYSSGSSISTSSSSSSSSSSTYSSSSSRSSRSSASTRSSSQSKNKKRHGRKHKGAERSKGSKKTGSQATLPKHKSTALAPSSPPLSRKPSEKQRGPVDRSPVRNREWSSSSRSRSRSPSSAKQRPTAKGSSSSSVPTKQYTRGRSSSASSSSSEWESSPHSDTERSRRTANRGRRDFAERKELRSGNISPAHTIIKSKMAPEPPKPEPKQQIKMTLKSTAPPLRKLSNRFDDDSDEDDWEKDKPAQVKVPQPPPPAGSNQPTKKRAAESPPHAVPAAKVTATSPQKADKAGKKSTATRREELLKQLKAVEEAIAKKRSKLPA